MDFIKFLLTDRGTWNSDPTTAYEARDSVRLGTNQYYTLTAIGGGGNTFRPDSTDANNPWDLLVSGALDGLNITGNNTIVTSNPDLSPREIEATVENNSLVYDAGTATNAADRIRFGPTNARGPVTAYRYSVDHNGSLPEGEYPVRTEQFMSLTSLREIHIAGPNIMGRLNGPRGVINLPYGEEFVAEEPVRIVHGDNVHWAIDTGDNLYGRAAPAFSDSSGGSATATGIAGTNNIDVGHGLIFRRANMAVNGTGNTISDFRVSGIFPHPFDLRGNETDSNALADPRGAFLFDLNGFTYYIGRTGRIDRPVLGQDAARPNNTQNNAPFAITALASVQGNDRVRQFGRVFAFRVQLTNTMGWRFFMRDGQSSIIGETGTSAVNNSSNSVAVFPGSFNGVVDIMGVRGLEQWLFGYDTDGMLVIAGSQIGANGPVRIAMPQANVGGVLTNQLIVEMKADVLPSNTTGVPTNDQALPNILIRTNLGRVYGIGSRAMFDRFATGITPIVVTTTGSTTTVAVNFEEVMLPAGKVPVRMKWSRKAYHILFNDGTLYGAGTNADGHLGTFGNATLNRVGNLPFNVVDWGYYVTSYTPGAETQDGSQVTMLTRFLLEDDAPGGSGQGIYFIAGTPGPTTRNLIGLGFEVSTNTTQTQIDAVTIIRSPRHLTNTQGDRVDV